MVLMKVRKRLYSTILEDHLTACRQMAFVAGPRQVGKTTTCRALGSAYLDWDNEDQRELILGGPGKVAAQIGLDEQTPSMPVVVFDELHKYSRWKLFLKGFFDTYEDRVRVIVTGSSRLDVYRRGGDSLMGRYFLFHMHPLTVGETARTDLPTTCIQAPTEIADCEWQALLRHGGHPEPFLQRSGPFSLRWRQLRHSQLFKEDVRDLTRIQELDQLAILGRLLSERSGCQIVYADLARTVRVSEHTVRSWITTLSSLHHGFLVKPWHRNVTKALRKEPKWFLRDWSGIADPGQRAETCVACHLLKAAECWTDLGLGSFELRYLRDKQKREVDFVMVRDDQPWFLVEVKHGDTALSPTLRHFQEQTKSEHAFQVVMEKPFVDQDCFTHRRPLVVSARTLLSQLP
jgi:uncharacterized protein